MKAAANIDMSRKAIIKNMELFLNTHTPRAVLNLIISQRLKKDEVAMGWKKIECKTTLF